jgi:selenocysteine lyase/cysteine desulfurase
MHKTVEAVRNAAQSANHLVSGSYDAAGAIAELQRSVHAALETYSNVHRGSGHNSIVTTHLFEQARKIVLEYLGLKRSTYIVIFCTQYRANALMAQLEHESYLGISSREIGLPLGVSALAVRRKALPKGPPFQAGGGTTRVVSRTRVIWASAPDRFEAGTPNIINVITFAKALLLIRRYGKGIFMDSAVEKLNAGDILSIEEHKSSSGQKLLDELRKTIIGLGIPVPTAEGFRPFINLDNGASTRTFAPVWNTVIRTWVQPEHVQKEIISEVRSVCSRFLDAPPDVYDVIFTSNTTEAINIAAESLSREQKQETESVVLNTLLEHNSNDLPWRMFSSISLIRLDVGHEGFFNIKELTNILSEYNNECRHGNKRISIVAVSGASNILGVFNDLTEISRIVHMYGAKLLVDAAQMVSHRRIDMKGCDIDYLAFSAHKVYAPFGTGVLAVRKGLLNFKPSGLDLINSSGEENAAGIAALGKSLLLMTQIGLDVIRADEQALTAMALAGLAEIKGLTVYGIKDPGSPGFASKGGVILFGLKNIMPNGLARELAERGGIGVRYGCHCSHLMIKRLLNVPPALEWFQGFMVSLFPGVVLPGLVRVSLGIENTEEDIERLIIVLRKIALRKNTTRDKRLPSLQKEIPELPLRDVQQQIKDFVTAAEQRIYGKHN